MNYKRAVLSMFLSLLMSGAVLLLLRVMYPPSPPAVAKVEEAQPPRTPGGWSNTTILVGSSTYLLGVTSYGLVIAAPAILGEAGHVRSKER